MECKLKSIKEYLEDRETEIYKTEDTIEDWNREFFQDWALRTDFIDSFMSEVTWEYYDEDFQEWINNLNFEDVWEMVAEYHLKTIKKHVVDRISEEEIFSRMTTEELEEHNKIKKELELFKVAKEI